MNKFIISFLLLILHCMILMAQEVEFPLSCNPVIREYIKTNPDAMHQIGRAHV